MNIVGDLLRGHTDAIILSFLEKEDSYGYQINQNIEKMSEGALQLTEATLYTVFKRLEGKEFIVSYWQDGNNNVKRKYYSITLLGKEYLKEHKESWQELQKILNTFLQ